MRPLGVGVQLPEAEREVRWPELRRMIRLIEEAGFDSIWVGDHLLYRPDGARATGPWEAWTVLAAIAVETERVAFGPLVAATSFHAPAMLAKKAATLDELSGGRLVLGLGAGWNEVEYRAFGFPFDHRASRFEEAFTIIRTLLREGTIDFDGEWYSARDCELVPRGPRAEGPPLMIGSRGPRVLAASLPHVDLWNAWYTWFGNDLDGLRPLLADVDRACEQVGRDPTEIDKTVAYFLGLTGSLGAPRGHEGRQAASPRQGPPEAIAADLAAYAEAGVSHVQLVLDPITVPSIEEAARVLEVLDRP
jgi:alkanesulfonate monooxygenase SsuD/methylene tetrahydromethanopterin reductase-like flavin-dependent oxidoreductase (luciferase family)